MIVSRAEKFYEDLLKYREEHFVNTDVRYRLDILEPGRFRLTVRSGRRRVTVKPLTLVAMEFRSGLTYLSLESDDGDLIIRPSFFAEWQYPMRPPILGGLTVSPEAVEELGRQVDNLARYFPRTMFGLPISRALKDARRVLVVKRGSQFDVLVVLDRSSVDIYRMPDGRFQIQEMVNGASEKGRYEIVDKPAKASDLRRMKEMVLRAFGRVKNADGDKKR